MRSRIRIVKEPGDIATSKSAPLPIPRVESIKYYMKEIFLIGFQTRLVPRTWRSLYNVLGELDYGKELSQQIESYLCGE